MVMGRGGMGSVYVELFERIEQLHDYSQNFQHRLFYFILYSPKRN